MSLQIPDELRQLLYMLGFTWPAADEVKLMSMGQVWIEFGSTVNEIVASADQGAAGVKAENEGEDTDAFQSWWGGKTAPLTAYPMAQPRARSLELV